MWDSSTSEAKAPFDQRCSVWEPFEAQGKPFATQGKLKLRPPVAWLNWLQREWCEKNSQMAALASRLRVVSPIIDAGKY